MTIEIWLVLALTLSVSLNIILYIFSREQARRLMIVSENINDLLVMLVNYKDHLKKVYNLEAFYGDETLSFLMDHTRSLSELLGEQYGDVIAITDQVEYEIKEEQEIEKEEDESERENVFYQGSRRSDP